MPAKTEKQFKFMSLVAAGKIKSPGLSKQVAKEFVKYGAPEKKNEDKKADREKDKKALRKIYSYK